MKRRDLVASVALAARATGRSWEKVRDGAQHEIWRCGSTKVSIPRHREINELTAAAIFKDLEGEFGSRWWRHD